MTTKNDIEYTVLTVSEFLNCPIAYLDYDRIIWVHKQGKNKHGYVQLYCGFDIETYTTSDHYAYMYIWQFSIYGKENYIVYGRTWKEFQQFIQALIENLHLTHERRLCVGVANLSYEHQFMKGWFEWGYCFARELRKPIIASLKDEVIEFRDVLMITGGSLKQLAKEYTVTQKVDGNDLGYNIPRNYKTPLTEKQLNYCVKDVAIVSEYMFYLFDKYLIPEHYLPMTKTGLLRREVKKAMGKKYIIKQEIYRAYPIDYKWYKILMQWCFRGGYTHGNARHMGKKISGFRSRDITSSYPYAMLCYDGYPNSPLKKEPVKYFSERIKTHCCIFCATFTNLQCTTDHAIESKSKCVDIAGAVIDNGRVRRASSVTVWLTEIDYFCYTRFYAWDSMDISHLFTSVKGKLPKYLRLPLAKAYEKKAEMKHNGQSGTPEYALYKGLVNSAYGMCVTKLQENEILLSNLFKDWYADNSHFSFEEEKKKAFLLPQWGIYCCSFAKYRLLDVLYKTGSDGIYCDTDSIKYFGDHEKMFEEINTAAEKTVKYMCEELDLDYSLFYDLGSFESEYNGEELTGKFLGAKRYIVTYKGVDHVTIAGLPKDALPKYCEKNGLDIYDIFHDNMLLDVDVSLKNAVTYNDRPHEDIIEGVRCYEKSSVGIYPNTFTLKLQDYYLYLINNFLEVSKNYEKRIY